MTHTIVVTGAAGFIGMHTAKHFLSQGCRVIGIDNLNDYYDISLKHDRLTQLKTEKNFTFVKLDIADKEAVAEVFSTHRPDYVVHLAAQAGVRYSISHPQAYAQSNVLGFINVIEAAREVGVKHFVYASSSSVYGNAHKVPFSESDSVDTPVSVYAATKKANELLAHVYAHQYGLRCSGLRFFTVYGPWGRPDMAPMLFTKAIRSGQPIWLFNGGDHERDFTYVDDIVEGVGAVVFQPETVERSLAEVYNIGASRPVHLQTFLSLLESELGEEADIIPLPMQPGDVKTTFADVSKLQRDTGYTPKTTLEVGVSRFVEWYEAYYGEK